MLKLRRERNGVFIRLFALYIVQRLLNENFAAKTRDNTVRTVGYSSLLDKHFTTSGSSLPTTSRSLANIPNTIRCHFWQKDKSFMTNN